MKPVSLNFAFLLRLVHLFTLLIMLGLPEAYGQSERLRFVIDSVKAELKRETTSDDRAYQYMVLAAIYSRNDSANTVKYALEGVKEADKTGNELYRLGALNYIGVVISNLGHYDASINFFDSLAAYAETVDMPVAEADAYNNVSWNYLQKGDLLKALQYERKALSIETKLDDKNGIALGHGNMGEIYKSRGNSDSALYHFEYALEVRKEMGESRLIADSKLQLADFHNTLGNYRLALDLYQQAEATYDQHNTIFGLINVYDGYGVLYDYQGDYPKALDYYLQSVNLRKEHNMLEELPGTLMSIGVLYGKQTDYDLALNYLAQSLEKSEEVGNQGQIALTCSALGNVYHQQGNWVEAMAHYNRSMALDESNGNKQELASTYARVAELQLDRQNVEEATEMITKALGINRETGNLRSTAENQLILGKVLLEGQQYPKARREIKKGMDIALEIELPTVMRDGAELLTFVDTQLRDYRSALKAHTLFKQMDDSLQNTEDAKQLVRLQSEFEFNQEKQQIQAENARNLLLQEQQLQRQRLFILIGVILVFALIVIGVLVARFRIRSKAQEANKLKEIGQFKEAMTGMIAHDLKNPLSVLNLKATEDPAAKAMTQQMLHLVTNMLDVQKLETAAMPLTKTSVALPILVEEAKEQVRLLLNEKNLQVVIEMEEQMAVMVDRELLFRVFVNLLTNAIKYSPLNGEIRVLVRREEQAIQLAVQDQGPGIAKAQQEAIFDPFGQIDPLNSGGVASTGLGLTFCKLVLQAHGSQVQVDSKPGEGATFYFSLPVAESDAIGQHSDDTSLAMSTKDREAIIAAIPFLKEYELHQAVEMEEALESLVNSNSKPVQQWVESLLNAAYAGNEEGFEELLAEME